MANEDEYAFSFYQVLSTFRNSWILISFTAILLLLFRWYVKRPSDIPPGPRGIPIFGYLLWLGKKPYLTFNKIAEEYKSQIFSLYLGKQLIIVLNNYEAINAALVKQAHNFSGRHGANDFNVQKNKSLLLNDGDLWLQHRRFMLSLLRDLGIGKSSIEPKLLDEISHFLKELRSYDGKPTDFRDLLGMTISNNISILQFGERSEYDDAKFVSMKRSVDVFLASTNSVSITGFLPWMRPFAKLWGSKALKKIGPLMNEFHNHLKGTISERREHHTDGSRGNYLDAYLSEQKLLKAENRDSSLFTDEVLIHNMRGLFSAGTETTSVTLLWGLKYMMKYPEIQKRVQMELDSVIGRDRLPSYNDCARTPFTEATIFEIERTVTLLPLNLPHRNLKECQLLGYRIPESSYIVTNLWNVHYDPSLWEEPFKFNPERFLTENGNAQRPPYLIPFSLGKRECLGKPLARMELYLYFASMLQSFTFQNANGNSSNMESRMGITLVPTEFLCSVIPR